MIRLEFTNKSHKEWTSNGYGYGSLSQAKDAANLQNTNYRIVENGKVIAIFSVRDTEWKTAR